MHLNLKTSENSQEFYIDHNHHKEGDSGFDVFAPKDFVVKAKSLGVLYDYEISCQAFTNDRTKGQSFWLMPRSSMGSKTPLRLANSIGLIDKGYRGNLMGCFDNHSDEDYLIKKGDRLLQICAPSLDEISYELVDELDKTERGTGGFGSTGK